MTVDFVPYSATSCLGCGLTSQAVADCISLHEGDTCPFMEILVKDADGKPVDLEGWTATAEVFYRTKLSANVEEADVIWHLYKGENDTYPAPQDIIWTEDLDKERVEVISLHSYTDILVMRDDSISYFHLMMTPVKVIRGVVPARIVYTTRCDQNLCDCEHPEEVLPLPNANIGGSEQICIEVLDSTKIIVEFDSFVTRQAGKYLVRIHLYGPNGEVSSLPRDQDGYCLIILK